MVEVCTVADIDQHIDRREGAIAAFLGQLVAYRTDSQTWDNPNFLEEAKGCQRLLADHLRTIGLDARCVEVCSGYPAIVAKREGLGGGRTLALNGHFDVVPSGDPATWTTDPWTLTSCDGRLHGRGVTDMKSGIAAQCFALEALVQCGVELRGDVWVQWVSDEEVVGSSTRKVIQTLPRLDGVVDCEPTGLRVMPVQGGLVHLRVELDGEESHAGNRYTMLYPGTPALGTNAIEKGVKVLQALQSLERDWAKKPQHPLLPMGFNSIMPGLFFGGPGGGREGRLNIISNAGTTPNYASLEFNIWYLPTEEFETVRLEIEDYLEHVCALDPWLREHPPRLTWKLNNVFYPPCSTLPEHPILQELAGALRSLGLCEDVAGFGAASELAWYSEAGIGGTLFGPGSVEQAHVPNESIDLSDVVTAAKCLARAVWTFCA